MSPVVELGQVTSLVQYHGVQAVARLLLGHLFTHNLDPCLTITKIGRKAPHPFQLPAPHCQAGRRQLKLHCHLHLAGIFNVSQTLLFSLCFSQSFFFLCSFKFLFDSQIHVHQPQEVFIHQASRFN